jgi:hypothetical protein
MGLAVPGLDMVGEVEAIDDGISVVLFDPVTKEAVGQLSLGKKGFVKFNKGALEANSEKVSR